MRYVKFNDKMKVGWVVLFVPVPFCQKVRVRGSTKRLVRLSDVEHNHFFTEQLGVNFLIWLVKM